MQCFQGKSVYKGIAMGPIVVLKKNDYQVKRTRIEDNPAVQSADAAQLPEEHLLPHGAGRGEEDRRRKARP